MTMRSKYRISSDRSSKYFSSPRQAIAGKYDCDRRLSYTCETVRLGKIAKQKNTVRTWKNESHLDESYFKKGHIGKMGHLKKWVALRKIGDFLEMGSQLETKGLGEDMWLMDREWQKWYKKKVVEFQFYCKVFAFKCLPDTYARCEDRKAMKGKAVDAARLQKWFTLAKLRHTRKMGHTRKVGHTGKNVLDFKKGHSWKKGVTLVKMGYNYKKGHIWKMGQPWKNGSHIEKWARLVKMSHTCKNRSQLEKWVKIVKIVHS